MPVSAKPRKRHNAGKTARAPGHKPVHIWHVWRTFEPIYTLLADLRRGEIDTVRGAPIMADWDGELMEVAPALDGWIGCWQRIVDGEGLAIDLTPLRRVQRYLANGVLMTPEMVDAAMTVTNACYQAYCRIPRERAISYSNTEQIAIEMDELGIQRAAA